MIQAKCAACHTKGKLDDSTTLALLDAQGNLMPVTQVLELKILRQTSLGKMPPSGNRFRIPPLTDEDYVALATPQGAGK